MSCGSGHLLEAPLSRGKIARPRSQYVGEAIAMVTADLEAFSYTGSSVTQASIGNLVNSYQLFAPVCLTNTPLRATLH